ncbi:dynamin family protein [uncultured Nostoc sp.]|uniref:dynamin family protein n=1 Tax=uncultured Nostoc sp. TaxID=340711 RepID=UPI0035CC46AB
MSSYDLEALTDVENHLRHVVCLVTRNNINENVRKIVNIQIDELRARILDKNLYLAVVGEASTGKSTFINALLDNNVLEAQALTMTTTCPTIIKYGAELSVEIRLRQSKEVLKLTFAHEPITISGLPGIHNLSLSEIIRICTTDDEIRRHLADFTLTYPATFLKDGICIIDTPGANTNATEHTRITRDAVERSDAAIIITPAKQIVSDALIKLITSELQLTPFLHRCIFLITGMDMIKERERDHLIQSVNQRLKRGLKLENLPPVFYASAQSVVDKFSGEEPGVQNEKERSYWQSHFQELKFNLFSYLKQQRALAIEEHLLRLINELFEVLEKHLDALWSEYREKSNLLEAAIIPDLDLFAQSQHQESYDKMKVAVDEAIVWIQISVDQKRDEILDEVQNDLQEILSLDNLKSYVEDSLSNLLTRHQMQLQKELAQYIGGILREAQSISQMFDERFTSAYQRLSVIKKEIGNNNTELEITLSCDDLLNMAKNSTAFKSSSDQQITGLVLGGILGAILLPGIGWIFAAWLGSNLTRFFGPSLEKRKETLWDNIRSQLITQFTDVKSEIRQTTYNYGNELKSAVDARINAHLERYSNTVSAIREVQKGEAEQLKILQKTIENDINELKNRRNSITKKMLQLKSIKI